MVTPGLSRLDRETVLRSELSHVNDESIAVVLDSTVGIPERDEEVQIHVYLVPAPGSFVDLLDAIEPDVGASDLVHDATNRVVRNY